MKRKKDNNKRRIRQMVQAVQRRHYTPDPLLDAETSIAMSRVGAVIKSHGDLLCGQLAEVLGGYEELVILDGDDFAVSAKADLIASARLAATGVHVDLPYEEEQADRTVDVDLIVYDRRDGLVTAYEIKRGHGPVDAGKRRQTMRDGYAVATHLRDYAERQGLEVWQSEFKVLSIYGRSGLPVDITVNGDTLDAHFGLPVSGPLWQSERYLRNCLRALLDNRDLPAA